MQHWKVSRSSLAAGALLLCALGAAVATPQLLGQRVSGALDTLGRADPHWLWLAALAFALSLVGSAGCWRSAIGLLGGRTTLADATARYGAGSLVNTFVPARAGDAVRFALFSRLVPGEHRLWSTGGAFVTVAAARAAALGVIVAAGAAFGVVPLWPLAIAAGFVAAAALLVRRARRHLGAAEVARLAGWVVFSTAARFAGATAVAAAVGIHKPLIAALLILPALDVSGLVPITPGNIGIASAAIAVAFRAHGVSFSHGLAAGITLQALETAVGLSIGTASVLWLAPYASPAIRRVVLVTSAAVAVAGATVLVSLL
ncbi:MAG TPA: lysylphosphatidylglycerol synthase domain-containing protein [Gaiellaceae bacterium]|nr:lysylphosphatidylglycerol synthase domain-containing protein [Gaiellaceae bacterium]